jgi:APA family basic amino acid/polyamine antiporter
MDGGRVKHRVAQLAKGGLKRSLGISDLFAVGYGDLGSSIYYALGLTAYFALGATPIAMALAALVFACTSLTYAEMTAISKAEGGGSASFARVAFNDLVSFVAGWGLLLDYIVTIAISIFSIAPYLAFWHSAFTETSFHLGFSVMLVAILLLLNLSGTKHSTRVSIALTGFTLCTQFLIVLIALLTLKDFGKVFEEMRIGISNVSWSPSWVDFWKGTAMAMVAFTGIESIAQLGSETRRPIKTLPRAVMGVMGVLIAMYMGISIVGLGAVTPQELGTTYLQDPLAGITQSLPFGSKLLGPWVGILAACLLFVAGNAGLLGASRLAYNMGEYYQLPRIFHKTHSRFKTPYISLIIFAGLAAIVILASRGKLHFLADLYNFGAMIAFCSAHLSLIALRIKEPELERPFRSPLNIRFGKSSIPLTAIIGALATFSVWVLVVFTKPEGRRLGFLWMVVGLTMYYFYRRKKKMAPTGQVAIEKIKIPDFKRLKINHILVPTRGGAETETVQMACEVAKIHNAKVTAIYLIEVPFSLPLHAPLPYREVIGSSVAQRAEAIAREFNVEIETEILRAREIDETILAVLASGKFDMLVLGAGRNGNETHKGLGPITDRILRLSPCRVLVCTGI